MIKRGHGSFANKPGPHSHPAAQGLGRCRRLGNAEVAGAGLAGGGSLTMARQAPLPGTSCPNQV
jgi:hypothetical protein